MCVPDGSSSGSHEVAGKLSPGAALIGRLNWGCRICFQVHSQDLLQTTMSFSGRPSLAVKISCHVGLSISMFTTQPLASPRVNHLRDYLVPKTEATVFCDLMSEWHALTICYWSHRLTLVEWEGGYPRVSTRSGGLSWSLPPQTGSHTREFCTAASPHHSGEWVRKILSGTRLTLKPKERWWSQGWRSRHWVGDLRDCYVLLILCTF